MLGLQSYGAAFEKETLSYDIAADAYLGNDVLDKNQVEPIPFHQMRIDSSYIPGIGPKGVNIC